MFVEPGPPPGHHVDVVEHLDHVDRAEQRAQLQVPPQMRQASAAGRCRTAVAPSTLAASMTSGGLALQPREHDQHHERRPLPDEHGHDRRQRMIRDELHATRSRGSSSSQLRTPKSPLNIWFFQISPATTGMIRNGVISNVRTNPCPKNVPVEQKREQRAEHEREEDGEDGHHHARPHRLPEERVADERPVVVDTDELVARGRRTDRSSP